MRAAAAVDPFYQDVPWDIIYDDNGRVIGEVFQYWEPRENWPRKVTKRNDRKTSETNNSKAKSSSGLY